MESLYFIEQFGHTKLTMAILEVMAKDAEITFDYEMRGIPPDIDED